MDDMRAAEPGPLPGWLRLAAFVLLALSGARALVHHANIIRFPFPLDSHEPAQALLSSDYAAGLNPCDHGQFPLKMNVYGWAYNAMMGRLCSLGFPCSLPFHRAIAAAMLLGALLLMALALRRLKVPALESCCLLLGAYGCLLLNVTPISRPDSLGLLLISLGFCIPFLGGYSPGSLALAAAAFSLAWSAKLYFLYAPGLLFLWLLASGRLARAAAFAACFTAISAALLAWLLHRCDTYFYQNYLIRYDPRAFNPYSFSYMLWQLNTVFVQGLPGALLFLALGISMKREKNLGPIGGREWWFYALGGLGIFCASLGGHLAARLTYAVQLVAWPLTAALGAMAVAMQARRPLALACLLLSAVTSVNLAVHGGFGNLALAARWTEAHALIASARRPMAPCDLNSALMKRRAEIFDSGFTEYYHPDAPVPENVRRRFPMLDELNGRFAGYAVSQQRRVQAGEFDLVADTPYHYVKLPLREKYRPLCALRLDYPQTGGSSPVFFFVRKNP